MPFYSIQYNLPDETINCLYVLPCEFLKGWDHFFIPNNKMPLEYLDLTSASWSLKSNHLSVDTVTTSSLTLEVSL